MNNNNIAEYLNPNNIQKQKEETPKLFLSYISGFADINRQIIQKFKVKKMFNTTRKLKDYFSGQITIKKNGGNCK